MSNRINELMDEMGLTYKDVEYFTGIDSTWVYRLAKEDRELRKPLIDKLVNFFEVTADYLLGYSDNSILYHYYITNFNDRTKSKTQVYCPPLSNSLFTTYIYIPRIKLALNKKRFQWFKEDNIADSLDKEGHYYREIRFEKLPIKKQVEILQKELTIEENKKVNEYIKEVLHDREKK